jgi:polysaccharide deacetylase family protein (PEP-CTERM system associated)
MSGRSELPIVNAMTVDVEEHFQVSAFDRVIPRAAWESLESRVERNTHRLLDLLDELDVRATFFVLGWVADRRPALVREIDRRGHEVASHGYGHCLVYEQTRADFASDVRRARRTLEDAIGHAVIGYRAPSFSITPRSLWALDMLAREGYEYDSSIFPIRHDRYGLPGAPRYAYRTDTVHGSIVEIPPATVKIAGRTLPAAGGGYFRLLPYAWTRWSFSTINEVERRPAVFYLHPWEIDPDQPRIHAGIGSRIRHYTNLSRTAARLRRLLTEFRFAPLSRLIAAAELDVAPAVDLAPGPLAARVS